MDKHTSGRGYRFRFSINFLTVFVSFYKFLFVFIKRHFEGFFYCDGTGRSLNFREWIGECLIGWKEFYTYGRLQEYTSYDWLVQHLLLGEARLFLNSTYKLKLRVVLINDGAASMNSQVAHRIA